MLTNRINVTYNIENIDADFDIFRVEKSNKDYYKYNILDSAVYEFKAAAVQWTFGATALVLFRKGEVTEKQFKESIMKEYEDVKIQKIDLFDSEQCNKCFYFENRLLAQLLINSMRTPKHIDNIHAILLTREKTLPNISALMNTLMETDAKERVSKELLLEAIDDFEKDNIDSRECISEWKSKVAAETEMITKKAMKKILNMRTGIASKFNRFLHEKYGVWIDGELRKGEFEATYQIGNLLNIKYEYNEKDYLDGRTFVYYVGAKSKRLAYPNACCMRKVISLGEELEYEEALPLMAVEFVRNSQYTVLPFPFKYLREYIEQC